MDSFDTIRHSARALHDKLVSEGANPFDGETLVVAAAKSLDLVLAPLQSADPALKGARALFDEQSGTIFYKEGKTAIENALLIAHEIGHAHVHAGSTNCSANDIDPSRSSESVPVGLQRVEDYGAHERRELQANIFAREFLLPQTFARGLHVEEMMTATAIAEKTQLPKNLVRQQLLDALLLPVSLADSGIAAPPPAASRPDPSQKKAVSHRGSPFQLQAGPGTGKTKTLINRVLSLLQEGIDPAGILILTFSNRAAGELVERLSAAVPDKAPLMWVGTFHAFGLDLLRRHHDRLGLSSNPPLFDRSDVIELLEEMLPTLSLVHYRNLWDPAMILSHIVSAISRAKDELVTPERYRELASKMEADSHGGDEDAKIAAAKCLEVAQIYDLYETALRDHGAMDFGDLVMRPAMLLASDPALQAAVQLRHRHVLVDEYQDVNRASASLLKSVAGDGKNLWVVGDSRQSIYRFRGASSENMAGFAKDYPDAEVEPLSINYRSTEQIVDSFVSISKRMGASEGMLPLSLKAERGAGPAKPEIRRFDTLEEEIGGVAANIRQLEKSGIRFRDQAVLCRTNKRLNEIASGLEARGIPVLHLGSLFERDEVRDLLSLLSLVIDPFADALVRVAALPRYSIALQDVSQVLRFMQETEAAAPVGLTTMSSAPGISSVAIEGLSLLAKDYEHTALNVTPWEFLTTYILDRTDLGRMYAAGMGVAERMRSIAVWQLLNFVREVSPAGTGLPIQRTLDRVRQLVLLAEERDLRQVPAPALDMDAVRLMTVHGSKGLEFEAVHIPGLTVSCFPSSNRPPRCPPPVGLIETSGSLSVSDAGKRAHTIEEECLFFVALSRARTRCTISLARKQPNGNNRSPSAFLDWFSAGALIEITTPASETLPPGSIISDKISLTLPDDWGLTDRRLASYQKCPRRFFYTHVLRLGGARKETAFSQTHGCLYELIGWLSEKRLEGPPTLENAENAFEGIWQKRGPITHSFVKEYRTLASRLIKALVNAGAGRTFREAKPIALDLGSGRVYVEPNEVAALPDGTVVLRRVRTGYKRSDEYDRLDYALYHLAGQNEFGSAVIIEAVHLTDGEREPVDITARKLKNRTDDVERMLGDIASGAFPACIDAVTCPRCPHFFCCPAIPAGTLSLK